MSSRPVHHEGARYVVVGGFGYLVNLAVFGALVRVLDVNEYVALAPAFAANTVSNFLLNRWWTFSSTEPIGGQLSRFMVVVVVLLVTNYASFHVFFAWFGIPDLPAQALAIIVGVPIGFIANRSWTYASRVADASLSEAEHDEAVVDALDDRGTELGADAALHRRP